MAVDRRAHRPQADAPVAERGAAACTGRSGSTATRIVPRLERVQGLEWQSLTIVNEAMAMLRVIVPFGRERLRAPALPRAGRDGRRRARAADGAPDALHPRRHDDHRARHGARTRLRRLHVLQGNLSAGELIVLMSYIAAVYTAAGADQHHARRRSMSSSSSCNGVARPARHRARGPGARRTRSSSAARGRGHVRAASVRLRRAAADAARHLASRRGRARGWRSSARPAPARRRC